MNNNTLKKARETQRKNKSKLSQYATCIFPKETRAFYSEMGQHGITEDIANLLADEMYEYFCTEPDAVFIEIFHQYKGIPTQTWYDWIEKYPYLKQKYKECKLIIASKRITILANHDPKFLKEALHTYNPKYDEINKYRAKLRDLDDSKNIPVKVVFSNLNTDNETQKK